MKKIITLVAGFALLFTLVGCIQSKEVEITDREGNIVTIPTSIERIVSTAPSNTEILVGLGLADKIIAVDNYSPTEGLNDSVEIINFREPDVELLISLLPDVIIASGHNLVGDEDPFFQLKEAGIAVVYIPSAISIDGVYEDINFIGKTVNKVKEAEEMIRILRDEVEAIKETSKLITNRKDVYFEIGDYSGVLYTFGNNTFLDEIITLVGANNIYNDKESWISVSAEDIVNINPDVIVTNQNYVEGIIETIKSRIGFDTTNAVINDLVFVVDGNYTSRGSQKIIEGIKQIAEAIYPDVYDFE